MSPVTFAEEDPMSTSRTNAAAGVTGGWLAVASLLLLLALIFHGPVSPDPAVQMKVIAAGATRWSVVHWAAAAAMICFSVASLIALASATRLTGDWWTLSAWALLPVGALPTLTTAVAEATVIANAAASGNTATYEAWWAFAAGNAGGFGLVALAVALIAAAEARAPAPATPAWASWIAVAAAIVSFLSWTLGMSLGIAILGVSWVVASLVMCAWTSWFGWSLARSEIRLHAAPADRSRAALG